MQKKFPMILFFKIEKIPNAVRTRAVPL